MPASDFITLHGVYSWVPAEVREQIIEIVRRKLKPGGLVMVSYNTMPGWASHLPMREIMRVYTANLEGDSLAKARHGLNYKSSHKFPHVTHNLWHTGLQAGGKNS